MSAPRKLLVLPGDGVGPEIIAPCVAIAEFFSAEGAPIDLEYGLVGAAALDAEGDPLPPAVNRAAKEADAILLGAVGGPEREHLPPAQRPEISLLTLRRELSLFANLRPARWRRALAAACPIKESIASGADLIIVRELNGGVYFGEPRGREMTAQSRRRAFDTQVYDEDEISRIARAAFDVARERKNKVASVDKCNVMNSGRLWRDVVSEIGARDYPDVTLEHFYADNCAYQLVKNPRQFDVILTDNLFGDVLSDVAAGLAGSMGVLPSASLGPRRKDGSWPGLYEPVHGTAPDIAGMNIANPAAAILSLAMALRYSLGLAPLAERLEEAVEQVIEAGALTIDLCVEGATSATTWGFSDHVIEELKRSAADA